MAKKAIITGVTGQDGYYLARHLLKEGYQVTGIRRRRANPTTADRRVEMLRADPSFVLVDGDITDLSSILSVVAAFKPDEFYHLAAQSHVGKSWSMAGLTLETTGMGTFNCLEAVRLAHKECRFYFAGSSEQFGNAPGAGTSMVIDEETPMHPESPYAAAKVLGYNMSHVYRRSYDMFVSCGILFNHESPLRGREFVTRKITSHLAEIKHGQRNRVKLGNMEAKRDWGYAGDYVKAMHLMLQTDEPDDFVIATGETFSVREFFESACGRFQLDPEEVLEIDPSLLRPKDVGVLIGNADKARSVLGWEPKVDFRRLTKMMCRHDLQAQNPDPVAAARAEELITERS